MEKDIRRSFRQGRKEFGILEPCIILPPGESGVNRFDSSIKLINMSSFPTEMILVANGQAFARINGLSLIMAIEMYQLLPLNDRLILGRLFVNHFL